MNTRDFCPRSQAYTFGCTCSAFYQPTTVLESFNTNIISAVESLGTAVWSLWTVTQPGPSWLEACTFTITQSRGLLLGTRKLIEELDSIWNHPESFCCTMPALEIRQLLLVVIQSKILTLSIVVSFDIQSIKIDRHGCDVRFSHWFGWREIP